MQSNDMHALVAFEQRRDQLTAHDRDRELARAAGGGATGGVLLRQAARVAGRGLLHAAAWLLRYGQAEGTLLTYRPTDRGIRLN